MNFSAARGGGGIKTRSLEAVLARLERPKALLSSKERAARIYISVGLEGLGVLDEDRWKNISGVLARIYDGSIVMFDMKVDVNNSDGAERVVEFRDSHALGLGFGYVLGGDGTLQKPFLHRDGRPVVILGGVFIFNDEAYVVQVDPEVRDDLFKLKELDNVKIKRHVRVYKPQARTDGGLLPYGVNGVLCELEIIN